jgi:exopolyphosphatase / guanosine-5'-triphosphate,3'-diphosphate pyrophosphatase
MHRIGAVDIGSNAVRMLISTVLENKGEYSLKKTEYLRVPVRLGEDVFHYGKISEAKVEKLIKTLNAFKLVFELFDVNEWMVCATSAMRETSNRAQIIEKVKKETGFDLQVISGEKEAEIINSVVALNIDNGNYLHIDVGGGSTELNVYSRKNKIQSASFAIGSVRILQNEDKPEEWLRMEKWVKKYAAYAYDITAIGTGGNINKIYDLSKAKNSKPISLKKIKQIREYIGIHTFEERINLLQLNPDRADVIMPASDIYIKVMQWSGIDELISPDAGLKEGIIYSLFQKHIKKLKK